MSAALPRLTAALADRYRVDRELGAGGMASVYLARDIRHERDVAIKVLHESLGAALGAERFLAEIRTTARLQHPHILTLIDSGEAEGLLWYAMPFVAGESLRNRLDREGALGLADALRIAVQVADALEYAHRQGIVHRDVKPDNILLSGAHAFVADFGVALTPGATQPRLTQTGVSLGTPMYMSPEQFLGDGALDGRTDLYALACIVYEMLTGTLPFRGDTAQAMLADRIVRDAPRIRTVRPDVPAMVELVLARALSRDAANRQACVSDFASALHAEVSGASSRRSDAVRTLQLPGRERELAEVGDTLSALAGGRGGVLLIAGEPGVGKTRLANTLLAAARAQGALGLIGRCYEMEGTPPFTPFGEVLDYVLRLVPAQTFREVLGDAAPEVARVQPSLRVAFPDIPAPLELPPDQTRTFLHRKYREFTERAARIAPQVVLLDDLHWADESSLHLLESLAEAVAAMPVLFVGTYRDTDLEVGRPFAATLERLTRQRVAKRILLRRLTADGVAAQLHALAGSAPPDSIAALLHRETDGNPFFVEEVFQHLREEGRLFDAGGQWRADLSEHEIDVPEGVRLVVGRRLERLGEAVRAALTTAAVIGPRFSVRILTVAHGGDEDELLDALDAATRAQLLVEQRGSREVTYAFAHELIRQTVLSSLSLPRRQRRHLKVADAYEAVYRDKVLTRAADVAHHLYQAGASADADRTVKYLVTGARQALDSAAFREAEAQCRLALAVEDTESAALRIEVHEVLGIALLGTSQWIDAYTVLNDALALAHQTDNRNAIARLAALQCNVGIWLGKWHETFSLLSAAAQATSGDVSRERVALLASLAGSLVFTNKDDGEPLLAEADRMVAQLGDPSLSRLVLFVRCNRAVALGQPNEVVRAGELAAPLFDDPSMRQDYCEMVGRVLWFRVNQGSPARPEDSAALRRLAHDSGNGGLIISCDSHDLASGVLPRRTAADLLDAVDRIASTWTLGPWAQLLWYYRVPALIELGRADDAYAGARGATLAMPRTAWDGFTQAGEVVAASYASPSTWEQVYGECAHLLPAPGSLITIGGRHFALAMSGVWWRNAHFTRIAEMRWLHADSDSVGLRIGAMHVSLAHLALGHACADDFVTAEQLFQQAAEFAANLDHRRGLCETLRWYAWMLVRRSGMGDRARARAVLEEALSLAQQLGLAVSAREIVAERQSLG
jgi:hypothetical protein